VYEKILLKTAVNLRGDYIPTYGFVQAERKSVVFNADAIASVNTVSGEQVAASIEIDRSTKEMDIASPVATEILQAAEAYFTGAQYLLRANVKKP